MYLRLPSRPIMEYCTRLRFAPYQLHYEGLQQQLVAAGLAGASHDMWKSVDDFGWLRVQKSPNWSEMAEEERVTKLEDEVLDACPELKFSIVKLAATAAGGGTVTTTTTTMTATGASGGTSGTGITATASAPSPVPAPVVTAPPANNDDDDEL